MHLIPLPEEFCILTKINFLQKGKPLRVDVRGAALSTEKQTINLWRKLTYAAYCPTSMVRHRCNLAAAKIASSTHGYIGMSLGSVVKTYFFVIAKNPCFLYTPQFHHF